MAAVFIPIIRPKDLCKYCDVYKANQHKKLIELLLKDRRVEIITLEAIKNGEKKEFSGSSYIHPDLYGDEYWKWFPSFVLFTKKSWYDPNLPLEGYIMGGYIGSNEKGFPDLIEIPHEYNPTAEAIMEWIIDKLNRDPFECKKCKKYSQHVADNRTAMQRRGSF